jgi:hypothetical protein
MAKRRGNPNWGKPSLVAYTFEKTAFEALLIEQGLTEDQPNSIIFNTKIKEWARKNCNHKYIPEIYLDAWGFCVDTKLAWE